jgi:hypothetical protein
VAEVPYSALAKLSGRQAGPAEAPGMARGLVLVGAEFCVAAAVLGERNVLWYHGVVLTAAAAGSPLP